MHVQEVDIDMGRLVREGSREAKKFLLTMYYPDLVKEGGICTRYSVTQAICRTDEFWKEKLARDFGIMEGTAGAVLSGTTSWRSKYHRVFRDMERAAKLQEMKTEVSRAPPPSPTSRRVRGLNELNRLELARLLRLYDINYRRGRRPTKAQMIEKLQETVQEDELRRALTRM